MQPDPLRWKTPALLCLAYFMVILGSQIVLLGLPSIEADLGFSAGGGQWVLSPAALLVGGPLTDGLGWEWICFINIPVAGGLLAFSPRLLTDGKVEGEKP